MLYDISSLTKEVRTVQLDKDLILRSIAANTFLYTRELDQTHRQPYNLFLYLVLHVPIRLRTQSCF